MSEAAVTSKGQITIPVGIRKSMRLKAQDRVVFTRLADGTVVMRAKVRSIVDLAGSGPKPVRKVRIQDMRFGGRR
jgi:AbrB family looped-hinge helix DNA binding protein